MAGINTKEEMSRNLRQTLEAVIDEPSFTEFLAALAKDWEMEREIESKEPSTRYSSGALGWENGSIGAFLDASCHGVILM